MVTRTLRFSLKRPDRETVQFLRHVCSLKEGSSCESSYVSSLIRFLLSPPVWFTDVAFPKSCWPSLKWFLFFPVKFFHQECLSAILSNSSVHTEMHILTFIKLYANISIFIHTIYLNYYVCYLSLISLTHHTCWQCWHFKVNLSIYLSVSQFNSSFKCLHFKANIYLIPQKHSPQLQVCYCQQRLTVESFVSFKKTSSRTTFVAFLSISFLITSYSVASLCLNYNEWWIHSFIVHLLLICPPCSLSLVCWAAVTALRKLVSGSHFTCDLVKKSLWGIYRLSCLILKQCCRSHPWIWNKKTKLRENQRLKRADQASITATYFTYCKCEVLQL